MELWKGKGPHMLCSSYRDINIKDLAVKDLAAYWRRLAKCRIEEYAGDHAFGGLHSRGADLMAMVSGQHWAVLQATQFSGFQIFVDLSSAFASLMRQLAFSGNRSDEHIRWLIQAFGMPGETFDDMRRLLSEPGALEQALVDPHMVACLHQLHEHTWFVMDGESHGGAHRVRQPGW